MVPRRNSHFAFSQAAVHVIAKNIVFIVPLVLLCSVAFRASGASYEDTKPCATTLKPLVIQIEFPGTWKNISTDKVRTKFLDDLDVYIREMTQGSVCVKGEITAKWYKLPNPIANYWVPWQNQQANRSNLRNLVSDSLNAADQDVDVSKYDFVILALGANFREWGNNGLTAFPGMLGWKSDESLMTQSGRKVNQGIAVYASTVHLGHVFHDVAHILAGVKDGKRVLPCLYDQDLQGRSKERSGPGVSTAFRESQIHMGGWDPMSCNNCTQRPGPPGISSWTRLRLGWLDAAKVRVVKPGEKVQLTLGALGEATSQTQAIKIPVTDTTYYLVENRQHIGFDKNLPEAGVLIMFADDTIGESRHGRGPVRLINANPEVLYLESAAFDMDKLNSFEDEKNGVRVQLIKKNGNSYDILVERR